MIWELANFDKTVQIVYPMRILEEDKAIEVRSEIIRTGLVCYTLNKSNVQFSMSYKWPIRSLCDYVMKSTIANLFEQIKSQI